MVITMPSINTNILFYRGNAGLPRAIHEALLHHRICKKITFFHGSLSDIFNNLQKKESCQATP